LSIRQQGALALKAAALVEPSAVGALRICRDLALSSRKSEVASLNRHCAALSISHSSADLISIQVGAEQHMRAMIHLSIKDLLGSVFKVDRLGGKPTRLLHASD
jgi:hypothetical protein